MGGARSIVAVPLFAFNRVSNVFGRAFDLVGIIFICAFGRVSIILSRAFNWVDIVFGLITAAIGTYWCWTL